MLPPQIPIYRFVLGKIIPYPITKSNLHFAPFRLSRPSRGYFTNDGIRGTTFKRPGLGAMLEEIRAGNVAAVIIKDQSRIGRDVVEVRL